MIPPEERVKEFRRLFTAIEEEVGRVIVGHRDVVRKVLTAFFAGGHVLLEGVPGLGKTLIVKSLGQALGLSFKRIQFTPDLMPSDIVGTQVLSEGAGERHFEFRRGPVFANIVLADEVNRATPKTQSALLECMEEHQVTVDGITYALPSPFFVIATQNNIELSGTYPLPEAQLDRFAARVSIGYPGRDDELRILEQQTHSKPVDSVQAVVSAEEVTRLQSEIRDIYVDASLRHYILELVSAT